MDLCGETNHFWLNKHTALINITKFGPSAALLATGKSNRVTSQEGNSHLD